MPKEPRRVPTVLGRVQNGPVARPRGSVFSVAPLQTAIELRPLQILLLLMHALRRASRPPRDSPASKLVIE